MKEAAAPAVKIQHLKQDFAVAELTHNAWENGRVVVIGNYWSGEAAPIGRHFAARLLWSDKALYVRFEANRAEPLVVSDKANTKNKTMGLWNRDVCEIFIAPDIDNRNKYFEFEIAPNGEWLDLGIEVTRSKRETDADYQSGMESAVRIDEDKVVMALKIPWATLGRSPKTGDVWLGNLFRCVGKDPNRGYLSWQATMTKEPNFHVPETFGKFEFVK